MRVYIHVRGSCVPHAYARESERVRVVHTRACVQVVIRRVCLRAYALARV